jgi:disulfide bond formation protein DsbB
MIESINNLNRNLERKFNNVINNLLLYVATISKLMKTLISIITTITCILAVVYLILSIIIAIKETVIWYNEKNILSDCNNETNCGWNVLGKYCWRQSFGWPSPECDYSNLKVILQVLNKFTNSLFGTNINCFKLWWDSIQHTFYNIRKPMRLYL